MGWFDGNPAHLWQHPPVEAGARATSSPWAARTRVVDKAAAVVRRRRLPLGGRAAQPRRLRRRRPRRRPATLLGRHLRAARLRRRERHLAQLLPLRRAPSCATATSARRPRPSSADMVAALTPEQLFDAIAIRVDGPRAWDHRIIDRRDGSPTRGVYRLLLANGVLTYSPVERPEPPTCRSGSRSRPWPSSPRGMPDAATLASAGVEVDRRPVGPRPRSSASSTQPDPGFEIVTPEREPGRDG